MPICDQCGVDIKNRENFRRHESICDSTGTQAIKRRTPIKCEKCKHIFKNSENYRRHIERCDGLGTLESRKPGKQTCEFCNKEFSNAANHRKHVEHCKRISGINIQEDYDKGLSINQICNKYNIGYKPVSKAINNKRSSYNSMTIAKTKDPEKFFFGGKAKQSRGEKIFKKMLEESNLLKLYKATEQYHLFGYKLDFAFLDLKLDIEIDGMQHYTKEDVIDRDKTRERILIGSGWTIYRIASKDFLTRPQVVFKLFEEFILGNFDKQKSYIYLGQVINGDKQWADEREQKILNSGIDFSKIGWTIKLGEHLGICSSTALRWVQNNMPKFYKEKCRTPRKDYQIYSS